MTWAVFRVELDETLNPLRLRRVRRWAIIALFVGAIGMGSSLTAGPADAAGIAGLGRCGMQTACDLSALHHSFPNYRNVCSSENCGVVAAADWESVVTGVTPSPTELAADYHAAGGRSDLIGGLGPMWRYWTSSGIDGEYLTSETSINRRRASVIAVIKSHLAVIAYDATTRPADIGVKRYSAGRAFLIADGFTPRGPLVVFQHVTMQMTWPQWNAQVRAVWLPVATTTVPVTGPSATLALSPTQLASVGGTVSMNVSAPSAVTCSLSSTPALWSTPSISVPCTGSISVNIPPASAAQTWTVTLSATSETGGVSTVSQTLTQSAPLPPAQNSSTNWSGYVVPSSSALVTDASGQFVVPTLNCADTPAGSVAVWVGIGGEQWATGGSSGALLQTGIDSSCVAGVQENTAWWEVVPATPNYEQSFTGFPVSTGDVIDASVFQGTNGVWETLLSDENTGLSALMVTGQSWGVGTTTTGTITYTPQGSAVNISYTGAYTAEWIVEDQTDAATSNLDPFADFGSVTFTNLLSSFTSWSLRPGEEWSIVQNGATLSTPTATSSDGFTVTYLGP